MQVDHGSTFGCIVRSSSIWRVITDFRYGGHSIQVTVWQSLVVFVWRSMVHSSIVSVQVGTTCVVGLYGWNIVLVRMTMRLVAVRVVHAAR